MRKIQAISRVILIGTWLFLLFGVVWNVVAGRVTDATHWSVLTIQSAILVGVVTIWLRSRAATLLAGLSGLVVAGLYAHQIWRLLKILEGQSVLRVTVLFGPLKLQDYGGYLGFWAFLCLHALFSLLLLAGSLEGRRKGAAG